MPTVYAIQHLAAEPLGTIAWVLESCGVNVEYVRVFAGDPVPSDLNGTEGLVVMGGSMAVYERAQYPFLTDEIRLIEAALRAEKPVLGICLGSQLLASALGAEVKKGAKREIGWFPLNLTEAASTDRLFGRIARSFTAYHWHGDVFDLPSGAVSLASSAQTQCQAFSYQERAYGLLFHLEATQKIVEDMVRGFAVELDQERIQGAEIVTQTREYLEQSEGIAASVFHHWVEILTEGVGHPPFVRHQEP